MIPSRSNLFLGSEGRSRQAFTLVEVMVSMLLTAIFMASVWGGAVLITRSTRMVQERWEAVALGWSRLERARIMDFEEIDELGEPAPGTVVDEKGRTLQDGGYRRSTEITDVASSGLPAKRVRVRVWVRNHLTGEFESEPETLETMFTNIPRRVEAVE